MIRARRAAVAAASFPLVVAAGLSASGTAHAQGPSVLLVGNLPGEPGQYQTIQDAVNAAHPGDFILVAPGDYHEQGIPGDPHDAGVLITTPGITLRGLDRNTVVVDGTKVGSPNTDGFGCDAASSSQDFGARNSDGSTVGRNGIEVWKTDGVTVQNLTVCNFLSGSDGGNGNEVWFNGGDGTGHIGMGAFTGQWLTASMSYNYGTDPANHGSSLVPMGQYGIFSSNESGPGLIQHTYSSNMGDSAYYVGACADCDVLIDDVQATNSALGFSGTNAGGRLTLENSEWWGNKAGIAPNALNNDDWPSPPEGACPAASNIPPGFTAPLGNGSCSVIFHNNIHDNNNQNSPSYGIAGAAPPGTGILLSGVRDYTVMNNTVANNKSWGIALNDFPDTETPPDDAVAAGAACRGGLDLSTPLQELCDYPAQGNDVHDNTFSNNGTLGNPGNGDIAVAAAVHDPGNCFAGNTDTGGTLSSDPPAIETLMGTCGLPNGYFGPSTVGLVCASSGAVSIGSFTPSCPQTPVTNYPTATTVTSTPIPHDLATMPNPCDGVPANSWCPNGTLASTQRTGASPLVATSTGIGLPDTAADRPATLAASLLALAGLGLLAAMRRRGNAVSRPHSSGG